MSYEDRSVDSRGIALRASQQREKQRRQQSDTVQVWASRAITLAGLVLAGLLLDGGRRDAAHLSMQVAALQAPVSLSRVTHGINQEIPQTLPAREGTNLVEGDVARTDADGSLTFAFPEGSTVRLSPNTTLSVRLLDYERSGRKERTLQLSGGTVVVRVGKYFGEGLTRIVTDSTVVASAGGTFRVTSASGGTAIDIYQGKVRVRSSGGVTEGGSGQRIVVAGGVPEHADPAIRPEGIGEIVTKLAKYDVEPTKVMKAEQAVWSIPDGLLRRFGLTAAGITPLAADAARKAECIISLEKLKQRLAERGAPERLSPLLSELSSGDKDIEKILPAFAGTIIDEYKRTDSGYVVRVRARDTKQTVYELTPKGITEK